MQSSSVQMGFGLSAVGRFLVIVPLLLAVPIETPRAQPQAAKTIRMVRTQTPPSIDGILDDAAWSQAAVLEDFHQVQPVEFAAPSEPMRIYLLYDDDALYIGAELIDSQPDDLTANILRQGQDIRDEDELAVILSPFNDQRSGYRFETNPNGIRNEAIYENGTQARWDWVGIWHAAATRTATGWTAEMAIPFKTLSFDPGSDRWGINFSRSIARKNERVGWVSRNRSQNATITGLAVGMTGMQQGRGLDIVPSLTMSGQRRFGPRSTGSDLDPSLDLFYKITPALNAALTINTDFSATEVDDRQVNLTRFGLFFPEKRDFFLRDSDIFEFGRLAAADGPFSDTTLENGRPFFSRRIGLASSGEPVDLDYGGKISGRIGGWTIGALSIRQDAHGTIGPSDLFVGRAAFNVLEESAIGMIATSGDPQSNLDNNVLGVDFRYTNTRLGGGRVIEAEAWYQRSDTEALGGDQSAHGWRVRLPNNTGWRGGAGVKELGQSFNPALGFVNRRGIRDHTVELGYTHRPEGRRLTSIFTGLDAQRIDLVDGRLQSQVLEARLVELENRGGDTLELAFEVHKEALFDPFEISQGVLIAAGEYSFTRFGFDLETGAHRPLSGELSFTRGDFFDGARNDVEVDLAWKPSRHFRALLGYEINDVELPAGSFTTRLARLGLDIVFSARLSWVNLLQYDNVSESIGINSRLHWIPQAGRELYFVLNHDLEDVERNGSFRSTAADVAMKLNYTFRF